MAALVQYWQGQRQRILERIEPKVPKDRKSISELPDVLNATWWDDEIRSLLMVLMPLVQRGAEAGVALQAATVEALGVAVDWTIPYTEAAEWARKHSGKLVTKMSRTTRKRVGGIVADWIESGEPLPDLEKRLLNVKEFAFSRKRAQLVAITETTNSYAAGEITAGREMENLGFQYQKEWQTVRDDNVCPICRPLHGERVDGIMSYFETVTGDALLGPSAHPGCRCWVNNIPAVPS